MGNSEIARLREAADACRLHQATDIGPVTTELSISPTESWRQTSYEAISAAMTTAADHPFAPILTAGRKVVFSRTLKTAEWANTTIAAGDTAEEIDKLRLGGDGH